MYVYFHTISNQFSSDWNFTRGSARKKTAAASLVSDKPCFQCINGQCEWIRKQIIISTYLHSPQMVFVLFLYCFKSGRKTTSLDLLASIESILFLKELQTQIISFGSFVFFSRFPSNSYSCLLFSRHTKLISSS